MAKDESTVLIDDKLLRKYLKKIEEQGTSLKPLLTKLKVIGLQAVEENFQQQGRPERWVALKPKTIAQRTKKGYTGPILQRTGDLRDSVTGKVLKDSVIIGAKLEYAATHHFGDPSRNIEARPFIVFTDDDIDEMRETILDEITKE